MMICCLVCFFFSSRRRHTRLQGDWSSDVCSSDLYGRCPRVEVEQHVEARPHRVPCRGERVRDRTERFALDMPYVPQADTLVLNRVARRVPAATIHGDLVASLREPHTDLLGARLEPAIVGGYPASA